MNAKLRYSERKGENMVHKNHEAMIDLINRNWESIAEFAYECYVSDWPGAININEDDALNGNFHYSFLTSEGGEIGGQARRYDARNEVFFLIQSRSGEQYYFRISTPSGHLTPPAASEESYRNAYGLPLDFDWLMKNDHLNELDQQANEHRAEIQSNLKRAVQDFLRALRVSLEEFLWMGLELVDLCPSVETSLADRIVLLSALKDGIVRIDDSDGEHRYKPGPKWANVEKVLSQPEADGMPSWWGVFYKRPTLSQ